MHNTTSMNRQVRQLLKKAPHTDDMRVILGIKRRDEDHRHITNKGEKKQDIRVILVMAEVVWASHQESKKKVGHGHLRDTKGSTRRTGTKANQMTKNQLKAGHLAVVKSAQITETIGIPRVQIA